MLFSDILNALHCSDPTDLLAQADTVRAHVKGQGIFLRGIIEFSNHCVRNCLYCGLRRANIRAARYRMAPDDVVRCALHIASQGIGTVVLQSGDDLEYSAQDISFMVKEIKRQAEMAVVLSVGEREDWEYALWREAGADRYLIKHETSDHDLYARLHPGKTLDERLAVQRTLKKLGYELGTGFIIGLPGQSTEILAQDILLVREMQADMCGVGPFVPQGQTALAAHPAGSVDLTLRVTALLRLIGPELNLPATTALATLDPEHGQYLALMAGANVIMPNFTPATERGKYSIYDHKTPVDLHAAHEAAHCANRHIIQDGRLRP